ncbi:MAG TPA: ABATE domain-containing protein [Actinomycetota bacterium]|nr:ABATE domain-containing protein [Actinomycetota bacterium]
MARALAQPIIDCVDPEAEPGELRLRFASGRLCLDLVLTVGERWRRSFERLRAPADLGHWLEMSGLVASAPRVTAADLAAARELREAIFRLARCAMDGRPADAGDLRIVNAWASRPDMPLALRSIGTAVRTLSVRPVADALATVARDAVELFGGPQAARVRECAAPDCSGLFLDESRAGVRRWCSMAGCGNRVKVANYRRRSASRTPARGGARTPRHAAVSASSNEGISGARRTSR